jgi:hypothetical protein
MIEFLIWLPVYLFYCLAGSFLFWLRGSAVFEQLTGCGKTTGDLVWAL